MARTTTNLASDAAASASASSTGTITITVNETPAPSSTQPPQNIVLCLRVPKKKVSWKEGTVDNEFLNRKSSKKCCIFHKQKPFDEDASDDEDGDGDGSGGQGGECSRKDLAGSSGCCHHGAGQGKESCS